MKIVNKIEDIDITKNGFIEASAGTGKTYILENLFFRILTEKKANIEEILIVTFTEKGVGELKKRVKDKIETNLNNAKENSYAIDVLQDSIDNYDSVSIYTIHGFCHTILRENAFENGQLFDLEVIDDGYLYEEMMYEQMRMVWPKKYGNDLPEMLRVSGFPNVDKHKKISKFIKTTTDIAKNFYGDSICKLVPEYSSNQKYSELREAVYQQILNLTKLVGKIDIKELNKSDLYLNYSKLNFNLNSKNSISKNIILPLLEFLSASSNRLTALSTFIEKVSKTSTYKDKGFSCLIPVKWNKGMPNMNECPEIEKVVTSLDSICLSFELLTNYLQISSIKRLKSDVSNKKKINGFISFNDMLILVRDAVYGKNSSMLIDKLRKKYKYVLVDEFQDTDSIQWDIFRKIFLKSDNHCLYLLGDPKQAIYGFRGADIYTYINAKKEVYALSKRGEANIYSQDVNYRSTPELIDCFNTIFKQKTWFGANEGSKEFNFLYSNVKVPKEITPVNFIDNSNLLSLRVVKIDENYRCSHARNKMANFIADEIVSLVNNVTVQSEKINKQISFNDICVLVRSKHEAIIFEEELDKRGVPHIYYKKPGLFQSEEAIQLFYLLSAISEPGNQMKKRKACLTWFIGLAPEDLYLYDNIPHSHPLKKLFRQWQDMALNNSLVELFQSIINDSGILVRELPKLNGESRIANLKQIIQNILEAAINNKMDLNGVLKYLYLARKSLANGINANDLHSHSIDGDLVKIMTIHSSKGLEFPVVFLLGGFTKSYRNDGYFKYHEKGCTVFSLKKDNRIEDICENEYNNEEKRLYYVALTRAKLILYIPEFYPKKSYNLIKAGAVSKIIYHSIKEASKEPNNNISFIEMKNKNGISKYSFSQVKNKKITCLPKPLFNTVNDYRQRKITINSFTSLIHKESIHNGKTGDYEISYETKEYSEENSGYSMSGNKPDIPHGQHAGSMLHEILEKMDYTFVSEKHKKGFNYEVLLENDISKLLIEKYSEIYGINNIYNKKIAETVWKTLTTPINQINKNFMLSDLPCSDRAHEVEFYFKTPKINNNKLPEGFKKDNNYITGFIDLIFRYKNKYYIADWKSNYLADGYNISSISEDMKKANYHLQYKLYTIALIRWLSQQFGKSFDCSNSFGGVFYFYLRGMGVEKGSGIFYVPPESIDLDNL